jgi:CRP-like cAMP-binding protein
MYIQQAELLRGMDRHFIREFLAIAKKEFRQEGDFLFHSGEKASFFFILIKGRIRLSLGIFGHVVHVVDNTGEAFGWSSLVGRSVYSASAECVIPTKVLRLENKKIQDVLNKHPASGLIFFRRLGRILGDRLLQSYETMPLASQAEDPLSFGTGQVMETPAI